jgi:hypothetical protein
LITGFFGVVKVVACGFFVLFLVERIGRKWSLIGGAFMMGSLMLIVAILSKTFTPDPNARGISAPTAASIAMIYLEAASYNMSWVCTRPFGPNSCLLANVSNIGSGPMAVYE